MRDRYDPVVQAVSGPHCPLTADLPAEVAEYERDFERRAARLDDYVVLQARAILAQTRLIAAETAPFC